jgi:hypothetical protein
MSSRTSRLIEMMRSHVSRWALMSLRGRSLSGFIVFHGYAKGRYGTVRGKPIPLMSRVSRQQARSAPAPPPDSENKRMSTSKEASPHQNANFRHWWCIIQPRPPLSLTPNEWIIHPELDLAHITPTHWYHELNIVIRTERRETRKKTETAQNFCVALLSNRKVGIL